MRMAIIMQRTDLIFRGKFPAVLLCSKLMTSGASLRLIGAVAIRNISTRYGII